MARARGRRRKRVNSWAAVLLTTRAMREIERDPAIGKAEAMRRPDAGIAGGRRAPEA